MTDSNGATVKSRLTDATIFFRGAELTHQVSCNLTKGENEIYIENLSSNIDKNSLKIKTPDGVLVSMYEFANEDSFPENSVMTKMQDSLATYNKQLEEIRSDAEITRNLSAMLQKGTEKNVDGSEEGLAIEELIKIMDYYKNKSKELNERQLELKRQEKEVSGQIIKLNAQIRKESQKAASRLRLILSSVSAINSNLTLSYYTPSASWIPYYDINVQSTDKPIKIIMKSKIAQTTGIDWEKVKLTLSTSAPSNGKTAPLFSAWFLRNYEAPRAQTLNMPKVSLEMPVQNAYSYDSKETVMEDELAYNVEQSSLDNYINLAENELHQEYAIDLPYSVPGDGKEISINMLTQETTAEYKYYCAPKLDTETYLLAEISDWQKLNLMSAKANITYDGTYVGESYIDAQSTHEKLSLTLGTDKRVSVKREKMHDYSSTKFLGNDIKQVFSYKITVRNNQNKAIDMVLKDQYPISTQKSIEVELLNKETTPWTHNVEELGVITWEENLKAGETKTYQLSYSVKYPKGSNLNL